MISEVDPRHSEACLICSSGKKVSDPADMEGHAILHSLGSYIAPALVHYADRGLQPSDLCYDLSLLVEGTELLLRKGVIPVPYYVSWAVRLSFWMIFQYERVHRLLFRRNP